MTSLRQTKWKSRVVVALLGVVTMMSYLFIGKVRERKVFVSKVVAGYRYHCTFATDWQSAPDIASASRGTAEEYIFIPSPPTPIQEWIAIHLLHQTPITRSIRGGLPQLILATETGRAMAHVKIEAGYPVSALLSAGFPQKHFWIDGCPATESVSDLQLRGLTLHYHVLLVSTPDYRNTYSVTTIADPNKSDQAEHEIQAVLASFHVEKAAASDGGK